MSTTREFREVFDKNVWKFCVNFDSKCYEKFTVTLSMFQKNLRTIAKKFLCNLKNLEEINGKFWGNSEKMLGHFDKIIILNQYGIFLQTIYEYVREF